MSSQCLYPRQCIRETTGEGSRIIFSKRPAKGAPDYVYESLVLSCGKCLNCRKKVAREWAVRAYHESLCHERSCFVTLTFRSECMPKDEALDKKTLQRFIKRLRKNTGIKFRYFACGEYGENRGRPHYHGVLFGIDFDDKELVSYKNGNALYTSKTLQKSWKYGFVTVGSVSYASCRYVASYVMKRCQTREEALYHEYTGKQSEFGLMSMKPGLGYDYLKKHWSDFYNIGRVQVTDKFSIGIPKYYTRCMLSQNGDFTYEHFKVALDYNFNCREFSRFNENVSHDELVRLRDFERHNFLSKKKPFRMSLDEVLLLRSYSDYDDFIPKGIGVDFVQDIDGIFDGDLAECVYEKVLFDIKECFWFTESDDIKDILINLERYYADNESVLSFDDVFDVSLI